MHTPTPSTRGRGKPTRLDQPDPVDVHVGSRIKLRRQILKVSQTELADALGLSFQQIQKYENGSNRISASRLHDVAKVLKTPPGWFFEGATAAEIGERELKPIEKVEAMTAAGDAVGGDPFSSSENLELLRAFARIKDPASRKLVIEFIGRVHPGGASG